MRKAWAVAGGIAGLMMARAAWHRAHAIDLAGKVVLITGGSRGLGFAMAQEFAREGARLVLGARNREDLDRAAQELQDAGAEVFAETCDVADASQVEHLVRRAIDHFGRIDVLVNNAGIITVGPVDVQTRDDYEEAMDIIFWGAVNPTLAVLPGMLARGAGRIVNITSIGGRVSVPHLLPYTCAKFALVGFSEGLRAELAKDGVSVVTVVPGLMRTGSYLNAYFKGKHRAEYSWFSLGSTLPVTSMSARRAARAIVDATRYGSGDVVLTPQAKVLALAHGIAPGMVADLLGVVNRLLPGAGLHGEQRFTGKQSQTPISESFLTAMGREPARKLHQVG